jgi:hypothetical protein
MGPPGLTRSVAESGSDQLAELSVLPDRKGARTGLPGCSGSDSDPPVECLVCPDVVVDLLVCSDLDSDLLGLSPGLDSDPEDEQMECSASTDRLG